MCIAASLITIVTKAKNVSMRGGNLDLESSFGGDASTPVHTSDEMANLDQAAEMTVSEPRPRPQQVSTQEIFLSHTAWLTIASDDAQDSKHSDSYSLCCVCLPL
jgi:hypothetical protein